jgi:hypothetical protein
MRKSQQHPHLILGTGTVPKTIYLSPRQQSFGSGIESGSGSSISAENCTSLDPEPDPYPHPYPEFDDQKLEKIFKLKIN